MADPNREADLARAAEELHGATSDILKFSEIMQKHQSLARRLSALEIGGRPFFLHELVALLEELPPDRVEQTIINAIREGSREEPLEKTGSSRNVLIPMEEYQALIEAREQLEDRLAAEALAEDKALMDSGEAEFVPWEEVRDKIGSEYGSSESS